MFSGRVRFDTDNVDVVDSESILSVLARAFSVSFLIHLPITAALRAG